MVDKTKLTTRQATAADYHAVMGISQGVYEGWDYLPANYHQYLEDPNCIVLVFELNGKVVSY